MSNLLIVRRGEKVPESEQITGSPLYVGDTLLYPNLGMPLQKGVDKELGFYFTVYLPPDGGDATAALELLQNAKPLAHVELQLAAPDAERRIQQVSRIPIDQLHAGTYELRIVVRHTQGYVSQTALFRVTE
jgi:hypothetical protein